MGDRVGEGSACGSLGISYDCTGNFEKAIEYHKLRLTIAKEAGDRAGQGCAYCNLGNAYQGLGDFKRAIEHHKLDLAICKELSDRAGEGCAYGNLGNAYDSLGDFQQAINYYKLRLTIAKEVQDRAAEGRAYSNLGVAYDDIGNFKEALHYHQSALAIAKEVGDRASEGCAYGNLGNVYQGLGDFRQAINYHELRLAVAKEVGDRAGEGRANNNLGNAYQSLGDFKRAMDYYKLDLCITKEVGDRAGEGRAYGGLGSACQSLGDFKRAIEYHKLRLAIAVEVGDRAGQGRAYGNLGIAYDSVGDFKKAIDCHKSWLAGAKEVGDRAGQGGAFGNLGNAYHRLGDFKLAAHYHQLNLAITKQVGDKAGEGRAYGNLGNAYQALGDIKQAIVYHKLHLTIAKDVGDQAGEGDAYGDIGVAYQTLGDFKEAIACHKLCLAVSKEVGDKVGEGRAFYQLGCCFELLGCLSEALDCYRNSVGQFDHLRTILESRDQWKIGLRNEYNMAYTAVWDVLLKQNKIAEALCAAERGRAQALVDLMKTQYGFEADPSSSDTHQGVDLHTLNRSISSSTVFLSLGRSELCMWVLRGKGESTHFRKKRIRGSCSKENAAKWFQSLIENAHKTIVGGTAIRCENRSLDALRSNKDDKWSDAGSCEKQPSTAGDQGNPLRILYDMVVEPIARLLGGDEVVIVPDGALFLAPYAAFLDGDSGHLCDSFRVRIVPSLSTLKLLTDSPAGYHCNSGALLVGDPCTKEILDKDGKPVFEPLPSAKEEVEVIARILNIQAITGTEATKAEVLRRLGSVALIHIAAHGSMTTGEIALAPNPSRSSSVPNLEDFLLTMADVLSVRLRARLVVLSCCHSGHGEIKAEGVVGIARAFMGAGARSVLVSLWAIDDEATLEFMTRFYRYLTDGRRASEALDMAMKCLRESNQFSDLKYWAPFVLIGDDVTIECGKNDS